MKRLAIAAGMVLVSAGAALAASCPATVGSRAVDESEFPVAFDDLFAATLGHSASCSVSFVARPTTNDPDVFAVYGVDYRGFLDDNAKGRFTIDHNGRTDSTVIQNENDWLYEGLVGKEADGTIRSTFTLDMLDAQSDSDQLTLDSMDYAELATMNQSDAETSLDAIGRQQVGLITHLDATLGLLTGAGQPLEGANQWGLVGGVGSATLGGTARFNLAQGFSILGGLSLVDQSPDAHYAGVVGAAALRFVQPGADTFRVFGEAGIQGGGLSLQFSRTYTDSTGTHSVSGTGDAGLGALYGRAGVVIDPDPSNQLLLSASVKQSYLDFGTYQEPVSSSNYFAADLSGKVQGFTTAKLGADWTTSLTDGLSLTSSVALGTTLANNGTQAYIFGGGDIAGTPQSTLFAEYGLDLGWSATPDSKVDAFVRGSAGLGVGAHTQIGAAYHLNF